MHTLHRGRLRRAHLLAIAGTALAFVLTALIGAGPAWAHAARLSNDPADNATLAQAPARVSATFNEAMQPEFAAMTVVGPDGTQWAAGDPVVDGAVISVAVRPGAPAGTYTVNYRATSADGHVVTGSWPFQVTTGATATPGPATPAGSSAPAASQSAPAPAPAGVPAWPFAVAAVAVVAVGAVWAVRRRS
ncbi:copper resistance protein CopC [Mycolicibacterium sp. 018/SC-01/001]|uniref:copper resistance CopC family protein n=1 Tax=Mycolicibacterium sp. 018/SC-01/001 TaxID=2592069 RepID=UPI00117F4A8A|nr:copper resistance CopC family protein [Mycolicibacterium sp. 018/SC-01/001]TRW88921.1 copper resistance protein CopC [Mycolicibacterium sp. 018/SC-01/001]